MTTPDAIPEVDLQVLDAEGGADFAVFGGYIEPGDDGWDPLLEVARDRVLDKLTRARSRDAQLALAAEAACHGLVVEDEDGHDGGWAA